ncbi:MAG: NADP-dependent phosphogluconate dehydrogenase [Candidatus Dadabacteria bacterium]|nr:MAG: NADP-dependent phosphogluconate dehydrogenase [Candidatus Dadabacteria bacterium]
MQKPHIGMIGLGVMGANLARNIENKGYACAVYNRTYSVTERFMAENQGKNFHPASSMEEFVSLMERPRQIFIMVKAGKPVDSVLEHLLEIVDQGDVIIDAGNSHYSDTERREALAKSKGIYFLGTGVSGGEEGALHGPSIMPGGSKEAWEIVKEVLQKIAAKYEGEPCVDYIGPGGSGHFVKMVHNGIEYGDMQLIAEAYQILREGKGLSNEQLSEVFSEWNQGELKSYLIEITAKIFTVKDQSSGDYLVDKILDRAGQKGTGRWTAESAISLGVPIPTLAAAVDARVLSSLKDERVAASKVLKGQVLSELNNIECSVKDVRDALYAAKIICYAQGMDLLRRASNEWNWNLNLSSIASLWRAGCIIRAAFLDQIREAFAGEELPANMMLAGNLCETLQSKIPALRKVSVKATLAGIPALAFSSAVGYYDSYRLERLPQNLTQAQRDFFGAHTYERVDKQGVFHTEWE